MWTLLEYAPFFAGAWISGWNFYLSFIREPLARWRGREVQWVSGAPLVGSLILAWFAAWHWAEPGWVWASVVFAAVDTGGFHWFVGMTLWLEVIRPWRQAGRSTGSTSEAHERASE